jgi:glycine dehydrogenase
MIGIRAEIAAVAEGRIAAADSPLRHAPHTQTLMLAPWTRAYDMATAFFPGRGPVADKYWPAVGRVDNVAGDRTLVCTCPPVADYAVAAE